MPDEIETALLRARAAPFECPLCRYESAYGGRCPKCDVMLDDLRGAAEWQSQARTVTVGGVPLDVYSVVSATLIASAVVSALVSALGNEALLALPVLVAALLARGYLNASAIALRRARRAHAIEASAKRASEVIDGERVAFSGMPVVRALALSDEGVSAIACVHKRRVRFYGDDQSVIPHTSKRLTTTSSGGELELRTDEGITVRVRLDHFVLLRGEKTKTADGTAEIIAEGTPVRVSGVARWVDDPDSSGMRSTGRVLLLEGTQDNPIVIEPVALDQWIDAQPTVASTASTTANLSRENAQSTEVIVERTGVRVSVDTERSESESAETVLRSESRSEETRTGVQKRR